MAASVAIGDQLVGAEQPCFVIAEIGVNHNGDPALAHELIEIAAGAGANAVKFQTFVPALLAARGAPLAAYQARDADAPDQLALLAGLAFSESTHRELQAHATAAGVAFLSSPFDDESVGLLQRLGVPAFKVASGEVVNHGMLRRIAAVGRPILMSTGMCTLDEVAAALEVIAAAGAPPVALLHCVSSYPAAPAECNLRAMATLRDRFEVPVGWSDHTEGTAISVAAVALGADLIEKHITLDRTLPGPDHRASLEPAMLRELIASIRDVERALGDGRKVPTPAELAMIGVARKSLHWRAARAAGHTIGDGDLIALRPGTGISPARRDAIVGRRLRRAVTDGAMLRDEDLE